ncbi:Disease resistance protein [Senna tora]|uniref:Disease resistance protein n=1 Tax=Senna tora TaxID=362788 RepID=A0A834T691_9FABA|nr:Disease resistance protein [Senna tora]
MEEVTNMVNCLVDQIKLQASYLLCLKKFDEDLRDEKSELESKIVSVKERTKLASKKNEDVTDAVKKWQNEAEEILKEVQKLEEKVEKAKNKCFHVSFSYSLAKQVECKTQQMVKLKINCQFVTFSRPIELKEGMHYYSSKDFVYFKSTKSACNEILKAIEDGGANMIGLYGIGGSGKTSLAKEVGKKIEELKLYDKVIMVVVSKPLDIQKIQDQISDLLDMNFDKQSIEGRAHELSQKLKVGKTFIILDDVWEDINLENIGIPSDDYKGCCVLLTTRLKRVCEFMDCQSIIELCPLTQEEAWDLFKRRANIKDDCSNELKGVARNITDECKGLPIAIVTVGSALKGKAFVEWESALSRLKKWASLNLILGSLCCRFFLPSSTGFHSSLREMEEVTNTVVTKIVDCVVDQIKLHATYLLCLKKFDENLRDEKSELESKIVSVKERTKLASKKNEDVTDAVKKWQNEAEEILKEVQKLEEKVEKAKNKCFHVSFSYSLAKQVECKTQQMVKLKINCQFVPFSLPIELKEGMHYYSSKDFVYFKSTKSACNEILKAIKDGGTNMIGLYGIGGSGKTSLAKEVGKKIEELKLYDKVIMAVVSQPLDIQKIQDQISDLLGMKFDKPSIEGRAQQLSQKLKVGKTLIILDDVWEVINLENIGIPSNDYKGCCVLLTTRLKRVCESMDCQSVIELHTLTPEEAWDLFKRHANIKDDCSNELKGVARNITDECKGLPIAIVTVGSALKGKAFVE